MAARPSASAPDSGRITVPKLNRDPIQSLCPLPIIVRVEGHDLEIPAMTAAEWLTVLMVESLELDDIFPGLLGEDDIDLVEELIISGVLGLGEFHELVLSIIEVASARPWWVTLRLIEAARGSWDILGGEMGLRGVDATRLSLSAWLDILLLTIIRSMEQKDVQMFTLKLEAPPPQAQQDAEQSMEMPAAAFLAMAE